MIVTKGLFKWREGATASRGDINRENMVVRGEFFVVTICQYYLPNRMTVNLKRSA